MSRLSFLLLAVVLCAPAESRFVEARGKDLFAPSGQKLLLKGINLGNWLVPEGYMFRLDGGPQSGREIDALFSELIGPHETAKFWKEWQRRYITEKDIALIAQRGFNHVRIPLHYKFFTAEERTEGFELLDRVIRWCRNAGLWVILDMHAAPGGQTGTNIDDSFGYPWLYESEDAQRQAVRVWVRIARHYRNEAQVLGFELLNEPVPHYPSLQKYNEKLEPLYRRMVAAIREVDPDHIILLGGAQWNSNFNVFSAPFAPNLVYTFHKYWTAPTAEVIRDYVAFRDRYNVPIYLGESGENSDEWIGKFRETLESNAIGWCFWPYKKMDATSSVVSFPKPTGWDEIIAYAKRQGGTGDAENRIKIRPAPEDARASLQDLLEKIQLENCQTNEGFLRALGLQ